MRKVVLYAIIIYFHIIYRHEHTLYIRVESKIDVVPVEPVAEEVNPPVDVEFDNCGTSKEPALSTEQGKPWMHLTIP